MQTERIETLNADGETSGLFTEILDSGATVRLRVTGSSMAPIIRSGDRIWVRNTPAGNLTRGDIVWFINTDGKYMVHRILKIRSRPGKVFFHTKGDAQVEYDPWTVDKNILGKIYRIEKSRLNRPPRIFHLETPHWRMGGIFIASLQIIFSKVILAVRERRG